MANENLASLPSTIRDPLSAMSGVAARVQVKASALGQRASEFGQSAVAAIDAGRGAAASGLSSAAAGLHAGADRWTSNVNQVAHDAADKIAATADYVREKRMRDMAADVGACLKAYPTQALIGAVVVGFFAGRMLRRD